MKIRCLLSFFLLLVTVSSIIVAKSPSFIFVALGDMGCGCPDQEKVAKRMIEWHRTHPYDKVLTLGDNICGNGVRQGGSRTLFADRFDKYYKPLWDQGVKFFAALGNHDMETNVGRDEIADKFRFHILGEGGYYSLTPSEQVNGRPLISFFALNSNWLLDSDSDPDQVVWLSKSLGESKAIWKVVYLHHPIYSAEGGHRPEPILRQRLENILVRNGVQLVLSGHNHFYARSKPQHGITYIVSGGGGRELYSPQKGPSTAVSAKSFHFLYVEVSANQLRFWAIPVTGPPIDQGTVPIKSF